MAFRASLILLALPVWGLAQPPDAAANQKLIEEVRSVRTALERLEKGQKAQIALARIQIDESRAASLEAQRLQLLAQEQDLEKQTGGAIAPRNEESAGGSTLLRVAADGSQEVVAGPAPNSGSASTMDPSHKLNELRRTRQRLDSEISALRERIAVWEKQVDEALR